MHILHRSEKRGDIIKKFEDLSIEEKIDFALTYYGDKVERLLSELEEAQAIIEMYTDIDKVVKKRNGSK